MTCSEDCIYFVIVPLFCRLLVINQFRLSGSSM